MTWLDLSLGFFGLLTGVVYAVRFLLPAMRGSK
jgi:hypothetical protein